MHYAINVNVIKHEYANKEIVHCYMMFITTIIIKKLNYNNLFQSQNSNLAIYYLRSLQIYIYVYHNNALTCDKIII